MFMAVAGYPGAAKGKEWITGSMLRRKMTTYHSVLQHEPSGGDDTVEAGYVHLRLALHFLSNVFKFTTVNQKY